MKHAILAAEHREILGKKVRRLRREGKLPANVYGHAVQSAAVTLDAHEFGLLYRHLLPTTVIDLKLNGQVRPVLMAKASVNPRSGELIHVEFKQVNLTEKVSASVAVVGAGKSDLMAQGDAILLQSLDAVLVSALPDELPSEIEVDLSALVDFSASIHVRDLPIDRSKVEILTSGDDLVFKLTTPQIREEVAEAPVEAAVPVEAGEGAPAGASSAEAASKE